MLHWFCTSCHVSIFNPPVNDPKAESKDNLDLFKKDVLDAVNGKVETMTKIVNKHIGLVNQALSHQEQVASEQTNLIKRSFSQQLETKVSYAEMVKGSCAKLAEELAHKVDSLSCSSSKGQSDSSKDIHTAVSSVLDKERRKLNVVVSNIPESTPTSTETREEHDLRKFVNIIRDNLKLHIRAAKCHRAGKLQEDRPRLLVVTLENFETKQELLKMSSQLRNFPELKNMYVNPDLTPEERESRRKLRQELALRRAAGENDIIIRHGSIVKVTNKSRSNVSMQGTGSSTEPTQPVSQAERVDRPAALSDKFDQQ